MFVRKKNHNTRNFYITDIPAIHIISCGHCVFDLILIFWLEKSMKKNHCLFVCAHHFTHNNMHDNFLIHWDIIFSVIMMMMMITIITTKREEKIYRLYFDLNKKFKFAIEKFFFCFVHKTIDNDLNNRIKIELNRNRNNRPK